MSNSRQRPWTAARADDDFVVRTMSFGQSASGRTERHSHAWHQLVFATKGVLVVRAQPGTWVVPPRRAVWVPAGVEHEIEMLGYVSVRTVYVDPTAEASFPSECTVLDVSPFLKELVVHICQIGMLERNDPASLRLVGVLSDVLRTIPTVPLQLPMPSDGRALAAADKLVRAIDAGDDDEALTSVGASRRTLERLFVAETGMTLGRWRQRARLLRALRLLATGEPVTTVALDVGYSSTSAFISMFRRALGTTPSRYYARRE